MQGYLQSLKGGCKAHVYASHTSMPTLSLPAPGLQGASLLALLPQQSAVVSSGLCICSHEFCSTQQLDPPKEQLVRMEMDEDEDNNEDDDEDIFFNISFIPYPASFPSCSSLLRDRLIPAFFTPHCCIHGLWDEKGIKTASSSWQRQ